uniref:Uncharacterized protein n=1 Tax=Megaselia scalaris TaxID=36166 RepID=T1H5E3_MEGSC
MDFQVTKSFRQVRPLGVGVMKPRFRRELLPIDEDDMNICNYIAIMSCPWKTQKKAQISANTEKYPGYFLEGENLLRICGKFGVDG